MVADGKVFCWGANNHGQLGNNTTSDSSVPVAVDTSGALAGKTVSQVSAGGALTCAIADSKVYCWGWGADGQLGNATNADSTTPVAVDGSGVLAGKTVTRVSAGGKHACVVASGAAYCWGDNSNRALGNGYGGSSSTPVAVSTAGVLAGKTVTAISASYVDWNFVEHTCAVADAKAYCWGANNYGQLGNGASSGWAQEPIAVDASGALSGKTVTDVTISETSSCALASAKVYCWGATGSLTPVAVDNGSLAGKSVSALSAAKHHRCALSDGKAYCWGSNGGGALGDSGTADSASPTTVVSTRALSGKSVSSLSVGMSYSCAVASGKAYCWGLDGDGQLGRGQQIDSKTPVPADISGVLADKQFTDIDAGRNYTCVVADSGAYCYGQNNSGQLGDGSTRNASVATAVRSSGALAGKAVTQISAGDSHTCAVASGKAFCWGYAGSFDEDAPLGDGTWNGSWSPVSVDTSGVLNAKTVTSISAGSGHTCAIADLRAYCWGQNFYGQLGNNTDTGAPAPVAVNTGGAMGSRDIEQLSAGGSHTCAVAAGQAFCWGSNDSGQLGDSTTARSLTPVAVDTSGVLAGKTVTWISAGMTHTCAVADGRAYCWGKNDSGQLGDSTSATSLVPVAVDTSGVLAGKTVTWISAGMTHTCAVADGRSYCWGKNDSGQLGDSTVVGSLVPVGVHSPASASVVAVAVGGQHTAALLSSVPALRVPGAPSAVSGVPGDGEVAITWAPPLSDGGSPILGYEATSEPGAGTCTGVTSACVIGGLANGQEYTFTVRARNDQGWSAPSARSAPVTPKAAAVVLPPAVTEPTPTQAPLNESPVLAAPSGVSGVIATTHKGRVKVTWKPNPGASFYKVRISKPGGKKYLAWRQIRSTKFTARVAKGKKYRLQVLAVGPGGQGPVKTIGFSG